MKPNLVSALSRLCLLNKLQPAGRRRSLLHLRILRPVRRGSSVRTRPPALIVEEPVGDEAAVLRRQHHFAPIDLGYLPTVDVVAHLRAQQSLVRANLNNGAGVLAVHHHTQENNVGRCGRWCRRRGRLHDRRRRRRRRTTARRKQRAIDYRWQLLQRLCRDRIGEGRGCTSLLFGPCGGAENQGRQEQRRLNVAARS